MEIRLLRRAGVYRFVPDGRQNPINECGQISLLFGPHIVIIEKELPGFRPRCLVIAYSADEEEEVTGHGGCTAVDETLMLRSMEYMERSSFHGVFELLAFMHGIIPGVKWRCTVNVTAPSAPPV